MVSSLYNLIILIILEYCPVGERRSLYKSLHTRIDTIFGAAASANLV